MEIAIIGCGNMGTGFAQRLSKANNIRLFDRHQEKISKLEQDGFGTGYDDIQKAMHGAKIVILAVKPQNFLEIASQIKLTKDQILVSLLTGVTLETLRKNFPTAVIVRMMPNLALIYGEGVLGLSTEDSTSLSDKEIINKTFNSLGKLYWLPDGKINALTALTGSGPGFMFTIIESMIDAGISLGFTKEDSKELVYQMIKGSLTLLEKSSKHPAELRSQITSAKGTTFAGLKKMEEYGIHDGLIKTFTAAYERAKELG